MEEVVINNKERRAEAAEGERKSPSPHFVMVHGIGHGAWCWYKIRCLLESSGYKVSCIDLKSAGIHPSDAAAVLTFDDYNQPLIDFLSALPPHDQVILVGHSAGGLSVTDAIHKLGKKIHVAIYVGATMLRSGFSTDLDIQEGAPDTFDDLKFGLGSDRLPTSCFIRKDSQRKLMYNLSPLEDSILASMLLRPAPIMTLLQGRFNVGPETDEVKRVYIKTLYDRFIKPEQQDGMIKRWPPSQVFALESDHSPFFSTPFELFTSLLKASASIPSN
ncbi:hypothetical protein NE237_008575 [Protea cynaroides]|uniref:AB hydrolase-1 domain-containing protein n=1 Tax=Protea cynaroides TaxID=273540 RepID=A0A9Q0KW17_9MAGN|nr:hypothetical protein NE237_008575 [Protea cynaroides]